MFGPRGPCTKSYIYIYISKYYIYIYIYLYIFVCKYHLERKFKDRFVFIVIPERTLYSGSE